MNQERRGETDSGQFPPEHNPGGKFQALPLPSLHVILLLAWPVLAQQGLNLVVNLSDRYLAGNFQAVLQEKYINEGLGHAATIINELGKPLAGEKGRARLAVAEEALAAWEGMETRQVAFQAAQTTANYLAWFISSFSVLVSVGSTALVARFTGAGDRAMAVRVTHQSLFLALVLGGVVSVLALGGGLPWLVQILELRGEAAEFAIDYLQPLFALLVFQVVEIAGIACLVGAGDTRTGLWVSLGVAVVNLPLAWGLCLGVWPLPKLGFVGISLGTALSHTIGATVVLWVLARGRYGLYLCWGLFWPRMDLIRRLLRISIPAGLDSLSLVVGQFWFLSIINRLGNVASGAHGIAIIWEALGYLSGAAFGTAAMTLVGQNLGAGRPDQASRSGWLAFGLGCGVMTFMACVFYTLAPWMFQLFCPQESQKPIIEMGVPVLRLVAFAMPFLASTIVFTSALRGAGDTRIPVLFTWTGFFVVRIPLAYFLTLPVVDLGPLGSYAGWDLGLLGAWWAMFADIVVRGVFFLYRFAWGAWHQQRV
jgi:putative MATE family efflux protein